MKNVKAITAAVIGASLLGACGNRAAASTPAAATSQQPSVAGRPALAPAGSATAPPCRAAAIALGYGPRLSPATGEHGVYYALRNRGPVSCALAGYPDVALYTASGARLPFRYTRGRGPYVTSVPPVTIVLAPRASAYVLVAKYRCDLGIRADAATIRITLPAPRRAVLSGAAFPSPGAGVMVLSYCRGGSADPGQVVAVSPIERAPGAASSFAEHTGS
jgi:hypothetical protein